MFASRPGDFERTLFVAELANDLASRVSDAAGSNLSPAWQPAAARIDLELETRVILEHHSIDAERFRTGHIGRGRDFRDPSRYCVFTVDPETARDLRRRCTLSGAGRRVGVHIADVSHYVRPGSKVDAVARARATTTYLVQRAYPMLPRRLCEQLCSLNPREDKLAFSVVWRIDPNSCELKSTWFGKGRSHVGPAPRSAPVEAPHTVQSVADSVRAMHSLAVKLRRQRFTRDGALRIDQPRLTFRLAEAPTDGADAGASAPPIAFSVYELKDSNRMIEEFMLLANCSVAHKLRDSQPDLAFLRRHMPPSERALQALKKTSSALGVQLDLAKYFCIGSAKHPELWRHYALNVPLYTHFTSPIRRYADVVVHRQLLRRVWAATPASSWTRLRPASVCMHFNGCHSASHQPDAVPTMSTIEVVVSSCLSKDTTPCG
uniref:RNB domain-containing protein n=1 Tax=Macrostomum lignano TaxID=282301 RepID=A0A1I8F6R0_9PLAT